ncbi:hypothetical protein FACS1894188_01370 [Clostridia bacterium]|nr:hypothetical protein FACS1894188_01370 [Clostridia bacterium]
MTYVSQSLSRKQLRSTALYIRKCVGLENELYFPIVAFLELVMPKIYDKFYYEIVPVEEMPANKHAETDVVNHCIRIREDVYNGAVNGNGRDRMTIAHEIAHYILIVVCGVKFARIFGDSPITYQDPEWQAKALAGEILCPAHLIKDMDIYDVASGCEVSFQAAEYALKNIGGGVR